jgi:hypothetical protein
MALWSVVLLTVVALCSVGSVLLAPVLIVSNRWLCCCVLYSGSVGSVSCLDLSVLFL